MTTKFAGKIAVITGASTGIGFATAKRFVEEGIDHVFITGRRRDVLDRAVAEIGRNVTGVQGDVANLKDIERLYEAVAKHKRKLDVIFANAGVAQIAPLIEVNEKFFDLHFDANVKGVFFTVQKGLPFLNDGGAIILTASIASIKGFPGVSVYSASKAAVDAITVSLAGELGPKKIRVNSLNPGMVETEGLHSAGIAASGPRRRGRKAVAAASVHPASSRSSAGAR